MTTAAIKNGNGFAQKALIVLGGIIITALMSFFVWLALAVVEIRVNVAEMKAAIANLETRASQIGVADPPAVERNSRRLDRLERDRPLSEPLPSAEEPLR